MQEAVPEQVAAAGVEASLLWVEACLLVALRVEVEAVVVVEP